MKVKIVDNLDENWPANVPCQYSCLQKLASLGSAVCLQHIIVHFVTGLTNVIHTARWDYTVLPPLKPCKTIISFGNSALKVVLNMLALMGF